MKWLLFVPVLLLACQSKPSAMCPPSPEPKASVRTLPVSSGATWELHFSPHGGCEQMVVKLINGAQKSIHVQAYGFTSMEITSALIARKQAGVSVEGVFDRSDVSAKNAKIEALKAAGIPVWIDSKHPIMHTKAMIVDGTWVELGSYNYTAQAENNAEDCYEEASPDKASLFEQEWETHRAHSVAF